MPKSWHPMIYIIQSSSGNRQNRCHLFLFFFFHSVQTGRRGVNEQTCGSYVEDQEFGERGVFSGAAVIGSPLRIWYSTYCAVNKKRTMYWRDRLQLLEPEFFSINHDGSVKVAHTKSRAEMHSMKHTTYYQHANMLLIWNHCNVNGYF